MKSIRSFLLIVTLLCNLLTACAQPDHKVIRILDSESIRTEEHSWVLTSVELRKDCTILEKYVGAIEKENTWVMSVSSEFIEDSKTGERFYIKESEIGFDRETVFLEGYKGRTFKEVYPPLPANVKFLNISSGSEYFMKSLDLNTDCSPAQSPVSDISFSGINLGLAHGKALKEFKRRGYKQFYSEEEEGIWGGTDLSTYLQGTKDDYTVTIKLEASKDTDILEGIEVLYQNHVDMYEVEEHLQEIADEIKATFPYRKWEENTPAYQHAASIINQKNGKDRIFKNVTIVKFRGHYRLYDSPEANENDFYGTITLEVHDDSIHNDMVISVRYSDRNLSTYIRRSIGEYKW